MRTACKVTCIITGILIPLSFVLIYAVIAAGMLLLAMLAAGTGGNVPTDMTIDPFANYVGSPLYYIHIVLLQLHIGGCFGWIFFKKKTR